MHIDKKQTKKRGGICQQAPTGDTMQLSVCELISNVKFSAGKCISITYKAIATSHNTLICYLQLYKYYTPSCCGTESI